MTCLSGGSIIGVDCNGNTTNGVRWGAAHSGWLQRLGGLRRRRLHKDVAVKYAAAWNNFKVSAAIRSPTSTDGRTTFRGWRPQRLRARCEPRAGRRIHNACPVRLVLGPACTRVKMLAARSRITPTTPSSRTCRRLSAWLHEGRHQADLDAAQCRRALGRIWPVS